MKRLCLFVPLVIALHASAAEATRTEQAGSFLIFPKFDISSGVSTQLRITNIADHRDAAIKLNYVCPGVLLEDQRCRSLDRSLVLTPRETRIIDVKEHRPPCRKGFAVAYAVAIDPDTRRAGRSPISYNYLSGSWHLDRTRRLESENSIAVPALAPEGTVLGGNQSYPLRLSFGRDYAPLTAELYGHFRAANDETGSGSSVALLSLDTFAGRQNPVTALYVDFWNAVEVPFSVSHHYVCWDEIDLVQIDMNFAEEALTTAYGSLTIGALPNCPLPGGCPPLIDYQPVVLGVLTEVNGVGGTTTRSLHNSGDAKEAIYSPR